MKDFREGIMETAESFYVDIFDKSSAETARRCAEKSKEIAAGFLNALTEAVVEAASRENGGERISSILFSCLHSSIFLHRYLIRIDVMGKNFYRDAPMAVSYWDAGDIYSLFEQDVKEIRLRLSEKFPRLREYEIDQVRYAYAFYYHRLAASFVREMVEGIIESTGKLYDGARAEDLVKILFGEYMGEADILFHIGRKKLYSLTAVRPSVRKSVLCCDGVSQERYFWIHADKKNIQPRFLEWDRMVRPGIRDQRLIYEALDKRSYLKVNLEKEISFMDIISSPIFMVSKEFANIIRMYCPWMRFKYLVLFDERNKRSASYQIPCLPEIDCLDDDSELGGGGNVIRKGILQGNRTGGTCIFRLKGAGGGYVMVDLAFAESAYRREVKGMDIEEFVVR